MGISCQDLEENLFRTFLRTQSIPYTFISFKRDFLSSVRGNYYRKFKFLQNSGMSFFKINSSKLRNVKHVMMFSTNNSI